METMMKYNLKSEPNQYSMQECCQMRKGKPYSGCCVDALCIVKEESQMELYPAQNITCPSRTTTFERSELRIARSGVLALVELSRLPIVLFPTKRVYYKETGHLVSARSSGLPTLCCLITAEVMLKEELGSGGT